MKHDCQGMECELVIAWHKARAESRLVSPEYKDCKKAQCNMVNPLCACGCGNKPDFRHHGLQQRGPARKVGASGPPQGPVDELKIHLGVQTRVAPRSPAQANSAGDLIDAYNEDIKLARERDDESWAEQLEKRRDQDAEWLKEINK